MYISNIFLTLLCVFFIASTGLKVAHRSRKHLIDLPSFRQGQLSTHNSFRAKHRAPPLILDENLSQGCQQYAEKLLAQKSLTHSEGKYGENLYMQWSSSSDKPYNPGQATTSWYNEVKDYNFNNPGFSSATGHFTQVVWKSSTRVGFGLASSGQYKYVVARYTPPGNYLGQFEQNVLKIETKS